MNLYSAINQILVFVYILLGLRALFVNPKGEMNRAFFSLNTCFAVWALGSSFVYISPDEKTALFWFKISSIGFVVIPLSLIITYNNMVSKYIALKSYMLYSVFGVPALFFLYRSYSFKLFVKDFILTPEGWQKTGTFTSLPDYLFLVYFFVTVLGSSIVYLFIIKRKGTVEEKKMANMIAGTGIITVVLVTLTNIVLPEYGLRLPTMGPNFAVFWVLGTWYAIEKHGFLKPTIEDVAKASLDLIRDGVAIMDKDGKILSVNEAVAVLTGYTKEELIGRRLFDLIYEDTVDFVFREGRGTKNKNIVKQRLIKLAGKKEMLPVNFSVSVLKDRSGFFEGYVAALHDIRKIIVMQEKENKNNKEIEEACFLLAQEETALRDIQEGLIKEELEMIALKHAINKELKKAGKAGRYTESRGAA